MTRRENGRVVELLRCAADNASQGVFLPLLTAIDDLGAGRPTTSLAFAIYEISFRRELPSTESRRECAALLEAAARVEEGSWP